MSLDAIPSISPVAAPSALAGARAPATSERPQAEAFGAVLERHLDGPRGEISTIRSEIEAIRAGVPFFAHGVSLRGLSGETQSSMLSGGASGTGFAQMPGWLDAQLAAQATGDSADPYGWRAMSRELGERLIGPGYGALFERQIDQESGFAPEIVYGQRVSSAGAEGIAQLMPQYYPNVARTDPVAGLTAGAETMRHYLNVWDGDVRKALASYNAGAGRVQSLVQAHGARWESALPLETQHYLAAILGTAAPVFEGVTRTPVAVFGGSGPGGVLTSPLANPNARRDAANGVDYFGAAGTTVQSPADGVVVESRTGRVVVDHGNGWRTTLDGVVPGVATGTSVRRSEAVGTLASGGLLRLSLTANGRPLDPAPYLLGSA